MAALRIAVSLIIVTFCTLLADGADWKARKCVSGLAMGEAVKLSAACAEEGLAVTWDGSWGDVDILQIEYVCSNVSTERDEENDVQILLPSSVDLYNTRLIPISREFAIECTVSGCYEDFFFDGYSISSITYKCETLLNQPVSPSGSANAPTSVPSRTTSTSTSTTNADLQSQQMISVTPTVSTNPVSTMAKASSPSSPHVVSSTPSAALSSSPPSTDSNNQLVIISLIAAGISILLTICISVIFLLLIITFASKRVRWGSQVQLVTSANSSYSEPAVLVLKTDLESTSQMQMEKSDIYTI